MKKRKFICEYAEFGDKTSRRIKDHISDDPIPDKKIIEEYFTEEANIKGIYCKSLRDYIRDEGVNLPVYEFSDGEYEWNSEETYHFVTYNMELKTDFIAKVLWYEEALKRREEMLAKEPLKFVPVTEEEIEQLRKEGRL